MEFLQLGVGTRCEAIIHVETSDRFVALLTG